MTTRDTKAEQRAARTERLNAALRDNLKRRKAQVRGRAQQSPAAHPAEACPPEQAEKPDDSGNDP